VSAALDIVNGVLCRTTTCEMAACEMWRLTAYLVTVSRWTLRDVHPARDQRGRNVRFPQLKLTSRIAYIEVDKQSHEESHTAGVTFVLHGGTFVLETPHETLDDTGYR